MLERWECFPEENYFVWRQSSEGIIEKAQVTVGEYDEEADTYEIKSGLSLDDYIITAFTRNNSFTTLSTYIYGVTAKKGALPPELRALTTIITLVMLGVLIIINIRSKRDLVKVKRGVRRR